MGRLKLSHIIAAAIAATVIFAFTYFGGPAALGAHPFWADKVGYLGLQIGVVIWLGLALTSLPNRWTLRLSALALVASGAIAWFGKTRFAASYAEDAMAGQFWFLGAIGLATMALVLIAAIIKQVLAAKS